VRLVALLALFLVVEAIGAAPLAAISDTTNPVMAVLVLILGGLLAGAAILLYRRVVARTEHRAVHELAVSGVSAQALRGLVLGVTLFTGVIVVLAVFGGYRIAGWNSLWAAVAMFGLMSAVAVIEEILFRGVLFRVVEEMTGTRGAMIVSALVFGGLHLVNEGATIWGALAIAVEGGLMTAAMFAATRSLWLPIGVHLGWNFAEAGLFGVTVSGSNTSSGLVFGELHGPAFFTGGGFGPEAGVLAIGVCLIPTVVYLRRLGGEPAGR